MGEYRAAVADGRLSDDQAQRLAVEKLQILQTRLKGYEPARPRRVLSGLFGWGRERMAETAVTGLYLYGGVGRGKSMLMDMFHRTAPVAPRRRVHFHAFMQEVHAAIAERRRSGGDDPVTPVADAIADGATLLCFDEMQIGDITDAMLVGRLFERLFARGVVVVATSNRHPDDLYKDGLNRHLFLPFIALLKERMEVHELAGEADHRQAHMAALEAWHTPLDAGAGPAMDSAWADLAGGPGEALVIRRQGREVVLPRFRGGVGRAHFDELCRRPLGPGDYLALAGHLRVLILDGIPALRPAERNAAKRFVTLIDALYEARVRLIASAEAEPEALYPEGDGAFEFRRTASRLAEMRSAGWPREG